LSCHSVVVVLKLVQTKQTRINIYIKETIQKTQYKKQYIQVHMLYAFYWVIPRHTTFRTGRKFEIKNTSTHITKTPTHYKTHKYTHPQITKQVKTNTVQVKINTVQDLSQ